jgi:uncharacterized protein (TIGR03435 family)
MTERLLSGLLVATLIAAPFSATRAQQPAFEVASIRSVQIGGSEISVGLRTQGDQVRIGAYTFREYVAIAYRVRPYQVTGPDWITEDRFDLQAKLPAGGWSLPSSRSA